MSRSAPRARSATYLDLEPAVLEQLEAFRADHPGLSKTAAIQFLLTKALRAEGYEVNPSLKIAEAV